MGLILSQIFLWFEALSFRLNTSRVGGIMICRRQFFDSVTYRQDFARNFRFSRFPDKPGPGGPAYIVLAEQVEVLARISSWLSHSEGSCANHSAQKIRMRVFPVFRLIGRKAQKKSPSKMRMSSPSASFLRNRRIDSGSVSLCSKQLFGKTRNLGHFYAPTRRITICGTGLGLGQHGHGGEFVSTWLRTKVVISWANVRVRNPGFGRLQVLGLRGQIGDRVLKAILGCAEFGPDLVFFDDGVIDLNKGVLSLGLGVDVHAIQAETLQCRVMFLDVVKIFLVIGPGPENEREPRRQGIL